MNFNARNPSRTGGRKSKQYAEPVNNTYPSYNMYDPVNNPNMQSYEHQMNNPSFPDYQMNAHQRHYPSGADQGFSIPSQFLNEPLVTNVAMQYGHTIVGQGKQLVDQHLEKYVPVSRLKYYFAVDTGYVSRKLALLFFPFTHSDWSVKYEQDEPVQPRYDINAPDLYIPAMAYVTYVVVAGLVLGTQNRFSPEMLGIQASSALAWSLVEIVVEFLTLYIANIKTNLKTLDLLAFAGYKYVGIIFAVLLSLLLRKAGYYIGLIYSSIALAFFLVRTLRVQILPESGQSAYSGGGKRRLYILLFVAAIQPIMMWFLSSHLVS
ncbi:protein YIF1B-A [Hetaerina americana]|uniref:protein YIF1B-A n=1 Tax=Hetaerina americana TaxID=62018 RepID=UPI003A7F1A02